MSGLILGDQDFYFLSEMVRKACGIYLSGSKKLLLQSRLQKRLNQLHMRSFTDYRKYVATLTNQDQEMTHFIDAVTTNTTNFFRESDHFDFMVDKILPSYAPKGQKLRIWSIPCSTGQEPYSLGMVLRDYASRHPSKRLSFEILGSDISSQVLEKARHAVYPESEMDPIPMDFRRRFVMRSTDENKRLIRIVPEIRDLVSFCPINLMDARYPVTGLFDIIFCRNVMIYYERAIKEQVITKLYKYLAPGGYIFIGHTETFLDLTVPPFTKAYTSVYQKPE